MEKKLNELNIPHIYHEFEGGHRKLDYRYDTSLEIISNPFASQKKYQGKNA